VDFDLTPKFANSEHRNIWRAILKLHEDAPNDPFDDGQLAIEAGVDVAHISDLFSSGAVPTEARFQANVQKLCDCADEHEVNRILEQFPHADHRSRLQFAQRMVELCGNSRERTTGSLLVIRGDQAQEKPLRWLWKPYLPMGKLVHWGGNSSQAKSPAVVDLCARVSIGAAWPDGTPNLLGPRSVILLNVEDDLEDTILPRYRLAGGDKTKLFYVKGTRVVDGTERGVILAEDMLRLEILARSIPDLALIGIDPATNYLGSLKMNAEEQVRAMLTPLAVLAGKLDIVAITIGHFNRREAGTDVLHRLMGAAAFSGVARAVYTFGPDPDEESKYCHVMTVARGCGGEGPALKYRTELVQDKCPDGSPTEVIRVIWTGTSQATAEDTVNPASQKDKGQEAEAAEMLHALLRDGKRPATECTELLKAEGYDLEVLNAGRVRRKAGVESKKFQGDRHYSWHLPRPSLISGLHEVSDRV
jgi:hypothetical protein